MRKCCFLQRCILEHTFDGVTVAEDSMVEVHHEFEQLSKQPRNGIDEKFGEFYNFGRRWFAFYKL